MVWLRWKSDFTHIKVLDRFNTVFKENILQSGEWERGKFDLITILHFDRLPEKIELFAWWHLCGLSRGSFSKKFVPSDIVKLGAEILNLFLAEKTLVCFVLFVLLQYFVWFWLTFDTHRAEKDAFKEKIILRKKLFDARLGNCSTPSLIAHILQIYWIYKDVIDLNGKSVLDKLFFSKWQVPKFFHLVSFGNEPSYPQKSLKPGKFAFGCTSI